MAQRAMPQVMQLEQGNMTRVLLLLEQNVKTLSVTSCKKKDLDSRSQVFYFDFYD